MADPNKKSNESPKGWKQRIVRAAILVFLAHLLVKFISLFQNRFLGEYFTADERDFFIVMLEVILMTIFLIGEEALGPVFLPAFTNIKEKDGEKKAWQFSSVIFNGYFILLCVLGIVMILYPLLFVKICTKWEEAKNPIQFQLASKTLPILIPGLICMCLGSLTYLMLNAQEKFFWAAFGDGLIKICILLGILFGGIFYGASANASGITDIGAQGLIIAMVGISIGGISKLLCHFLALGKTVKRISLTLLTDKRYIRMFFAMILPLLLGIIFAKFRDVYNNSRALSLETGLISANKFGKNIADAIHYLIPYAVSIALLPYFCMLAESKEEEKFSEVLRNSIRSMLFLFVPISLILIVISFPLTRAVYEVGKFSIADSQLTSIALAIYAGGLCFNAVEAIFMHAFFSRRSMWTPIIIGWICSILSIVISYLGIEVFKNHGAAALAVVSGGFIFSRAVKAFLLGFILQKRAPFFTRNTGIQSVKTIIFGGLTAFSAAWILYYPVDMGIQYCLGIESLGQNNTAKSLLLLSGSAIVGCGAFLTFFLVSCRAGFHEPRWLYDWSVQKYPKLERFKIERLLFGKNKGS